MRKTISQILAGLLSLAVLGTAIGQDTSRDNTLLEDGATEAPEIRRYTVEVIVFEYAQDVSTGSEKFIPDVIEEEQALEDLVFGDELEILEQQAPAPQADVGPLPDTEFVLLTGDEYQLDEVMEHLTRLDVYEPLMHFGWTQATWPEEQTEAIPLRRFAEPPEGLDGNLTLYLSRYLHLVVDLQLDAPQVMVFSAGEIDRNADLTTTGDLLGYMEDQGPSAPLQYQIEENRILKNGELRYFDHPKFGVLAMVTRVEDEEEDPDDGGELLGYGPE